MTTREEILKHREILKELEAKLEIEEKERRLNATRELRGTAELLHGIACTYNHTDGCSWGYEVDSENLDAVWECATHKEYLSRVERILKEGIVSKDTLHSMLLQLSELKKKYPWVQLYFNFNRIH